MVVVIVGAEVVWEGSVDNDCSSVNNNDGDPARDCDSNPSAASNPSTSLPISVAVAVASPFSFSLASSSNEASSSSSSSFFISNFRFLNGRDEDEDSDEVTVEDVDEQAAGEGVEAEKSSCRAVVVGEDVEVDGELMLNNLTGFSFRWPSSS